MIDSIKMIVKQIPALEQNKRILSDWKAEDYYLETEHPIDCADLVLNG
ncbi:hypothetical protein V7152_12475 [Neobacillus drentensis]